MTIPDELAALVDHPLVRGSIGQFLNLVTSKAPNPYYQDAGDEEEDDDIPDITLDQDGTKASGYGKFPGAGKAIKDMTDKAPEHLTPTIQQLLNGHVKWFDIETLLNDD